MNTVNYWVGARGFVTLDEALRWAYKVAAGLCRKEGDRRTPVLVTRDGDGSVCARVPVPLTPSRRLVKWAP